MAGGEPGSVAVVVPAYNAADFLAETLTSIVEQTVDQWSCVVVDDGSTDATADVVAEFAASDPRIRLVQQANAGVAAARNTGIRATQSEYLLFLDADDLLEPDAIERLRAVLVAAPDAPAAHGTATVIDAGGGHSTARGYEQEFGRRRLVEAQRGPVLRPRTEPVPASSPTGPETLLLRNPVTTPGQALVRRSALQRTEWFDVEAPPSEDWDLWIRLSRQGPLEFLPEPIIRYRSHEGGASRQLSTMRKAELRVRHKAVRAARAATDGAGAGAERLARRGLRAVELTRAGERARSAFHRLVRGDVREAGRDAVRTGSSLYQVVWSLLPTVR
ncbi:MAG: glycosyltransferase family 2 protein [Ilumatobacter sp.]|uniref:glycosyltransferase family 2 protein n=1 Tax=Ilumatobacter sp. TaxID=1967498 RepID=UPI0026040D2B|nr:glycosyltransferase family 2 protein [Ilumatobacter sp.]MDJ0768705.1 glycosyltransferase family 2 protein [Ilumatobacter sp.]